MTDMPGKLKVLREQAGLRQCQIADFLGVDQTFISKVETGERNLKVDQLETLLNLYGHNLESFVKFESDTYPIQFAFRSQDLAQEDLKVIADIGRIAINSRFMAKVLREGHDR